MARRKETIELLDTETPTEFKQSEDSKPTVYRWGADKFDPHQIIIRKDYGSYILEMPLDVFEALG